MKFSIIIPIYNVEMYLKECLDSVLNQTNKLFDTEVLLIDDGSTDGSSKIAKDYEQKDNHFIYYYKENGGLSDARNYGVKKAKGKYLIFLDSDDKLSLNCCQKLSDVIDQHHPELILFNFNLYYDNGNKEKYSHSLSEGFVLAKKYLMQTPCAWNKVILKDIFIKNQLSFPVGLWYEDRGLTTQYVNYVHSIYFIDEELLDYRQRIGSITKQKTFNPKILDIYEIMDLVYNNSNLNDYYLEIEYIYILELLLSYGTMFIKFDKKELVQKNLKILNEKFPNWYKNLYLKEHKLQFIFCQLLRYKLFNFAKLIVKLKDK